MKENNEKLVIEGNAFYEIDDDCLRTKEQKSEKQRKMKRQEDTKGDEKEMIKTTGT